MPSLKDTGHTYTQSLLALPCATHRKVWLSKCDLILTPKVTKLIIDFFPNSSDYVHEVRWLSNYVAKDVYLIMVCI